MSENQILRKILKEAEFLQAQGESLLAVFDLDSTLFDLALRVGAIVDTFISDPTIARKFPHECELASKMRILKTDWGLGEPLGRAGICMEESEEFCRSLHQFWETCFFSNHYLKHDEPFPGAVDYVNALLECGADIMYLTGRDEPRMLEGTEKSLCDCGFPVNENCVSVVLKPHSGLDDARFKADVLIEAQTRYKKIWLFENEPVNLNLIARDCPEIGLVFIDSTHCGREAIDPQIARIEHFKI